MPSGVPAKSATNKTEFSRYVDARPESVELFARRLTEFRKIGRHEFFGSWMRSKHLKEFLAGYRTWWLAHPELFGEIYREAPQDLLSAP